MLKASHEYVHVKAIGTVNLCSLPFNQSIYIANCGVMKLLSNHFKKVSTYGLLVFTSCLLFIWQLQSRYHFMISFAMVVFSSMSTSLVLLG